MEALQEEGPLAAEIQYLTKDPKFDVEKPYYLHYDYDYDLPRANTAPETKQVNIRNARHIQIASKDMFLKYGFTKLDVTCSLRPEEYFDSARVEEVLYSEYVTLVRSLFPDAARIEVLEHGARSRDPEFPASGRERHKYSQNQPSDYAHIDYTGSSAEKSGRKKFGIERGQYRKIVAVNLWKPIKGPVYDWPLTLCDRRTVDYSSQTIAMDLVTNHYENENTRIYYDAAHQWYYWEGLREDEVLVFMQSDSDAEDRAGVPHTAFANPRAPEHVEPRQSVEVRVIAYFD